MPSMSRPRMFFSGLDRREHLDLLAEEGAAGMVSAPSILSPGSDLLQAILATPAVPLALDCGYKRRPSFIQYADLLARLEDTCPGRFAWYVAYDTPGGNQEESDCFYEQLAARLPHLRPRLRQVFQATWGNRYSRNACLKRLEEACRQEISVAIGNLVPIIKGGRAQALTVLREIGEVLEGAYPTEAHLLGISSPDLLLWLRTQPWVSSVDSGRWIKAARAREVVQLTGTQRNARQLHLALSQQECARLTIRSLQQLLDPDTAVWSEIWPSEVDGETTDLSDPLGLVLHSGARRVVVSEPSGSSRQEEHWYVPLFQHGEREYGFLSAFQGPPLRLDTVTSWQIIWDAHSAVLEVPSPRQFLVDGKVKTGLYSHDDPFSPCLCAYPLPTALAVVKGLVPFSDPR